MWRLWLNPFLLSLLLVSLLVGCGRGPQSAESDHQDWVTAARLTQHDAYTLQFKLYHAGIPHEFDQNAERTLLRVPAAYLEKTTNIVFAHTKSSSQPRRSSVIE